MANDLSTYLSGVSDPADLTALTARVTTNETKIAALEAAGGGNGGSNVSSDGGVTSGGTWYTVGSDGGSTYLWRSLNRIHWVKGANPLITGQINTDAKHVGAVGDTVIVGDNAGNLARSLDGGDTWTMLPAGLGHPDNAGTLSVNFILNNGNKAWLIAFEDGVFSMSKDNGDSWFSLSRTLGGSNPNTTDVFGLATNKANIWMVAYSNYMSITIDNGDSWSEVAMPGAVSQVAWLGGTNWVAVGANVDVLMVSADDGQNWRTVLDEEVGGEPRTSTACKRLVADGQGRALLITSAGEYLSTKNHGVTWHNSTNHRGIGTSGALDVATDGKGTWMVDVGTAYVGSIDNLTTFNIVGGTDVVGKLGGTVYAYPATGGEEPGSGGDPDPNATDYDFTDFTNNSAGVSTSDDNGEEVIAVAAMADYAALNIGLHDNFRIEVEGSIDPTDSVADLAVLRNAAGEGVKLRVESRSNLTSGFVDGQDSFGAQNGGAGGGNDYHAASVYHSIKIEMINGTLNVYINDMENVFDSLTPASAGADYTWFGLGVGTWKNLKITDISQTSGGEATALEAGSHTQSEGTVEIITEGDDVITRISSQGDMAIWDLGLSTNFFVEMESRVPINTDAAEYGFYRTSTGRGELARLGVSIPHGDGFVGVVQTGWSGLEGTAGQATIDVDGGTWYSVRMEYKNGELIFYVNGTERQRTAPVEISNDHTYFGLGWGDHRNLKYGPIDQSPGEAPFTEGDLSTWTGSNDTLYDTGDGNAISLSNGGHTYFNTGLSDNFAFECEVSISTSVTDLMFGRNAQGLGPYFRVSADAGYPSGFSDGDDNNFQSWNVSAAAHSNPSKTFANNTWLPIRIEVAGGTATAYVNGAKYTEIAFTERAGHTFVGLANQGAIRKPRWTTITPPVDTGGTPGEDSNGYYIAQRNGNVHHISIADVTGAASDTITTKTPMGDQLETYYLRSGAAAGDHVILSPATGVPRYSADKGTAWTDVVLNVTEGSGEWLIDTNGANFWVMARRSGQIYTSTDGINFTLDTTLAGDSSWGLAVQDDGKVLVGGNSDLHVRETDGTWNRITTTIAYLWELDTSNNTTIIAPYSASSLYKTTDGGANVTEIPNVNNAGVWSSIDSDNAGFWIATCLSTTANLHYSSDDGDNWSSVNIPVVDAQSNAIKPTDCKYLGGGRWLLITEGDGVYYINDTSDLGNVASYTKLDWTFPELGTGVNGYLHQLITQK